MPTPYTFGQLKADVRASAFPDGEAENLIAAHDKLFIEAIMDIQQNCKAYQQNNSQIVKFCNTYFQCGMTVFQAPRGVIKKLSTFAQIDANCQPDPDAPTNWCDEVVYSRVPWHKLVKLLDTKLQCACQTPFTGLNGISFPMCQKLLGQAYPAPTDADYVGFPELPLGFHYPQTSTDLPYRADIGIWALQNNNIYLAPWINSTEIILLEWDGLKRDWTDNDWVDTEYEPLLEKAVKHYVLMVHFRDYERDQEMAAIHEMEYHGNLLKGGNIIGALPNLIREANEETRQREVREGDSIARMSDITLEQQTNGVIP